MDRGSWDIHWSQLNRGWQQKMTSLLSIILVNIANVLGAIGALFFKMASDTIKLNNFFRSRKLMLGVLMYFASAVIYIIALKNGELTILYPMVATVYIWVSLLSLYVLKEKMNVYKWLGILAILVGVSFVGIG